MEYLYISIKKQFIYFQREQFLTKNGHLFDTLRTDISHSKKIN
jgi:hypothetical protein